MAYNTGGKIEAADFNSLRSDVNDVYAGGSGDFGYGQSPIAAVGTDDPVTITEWNELLGVIHNCADHQGSTVAVPTSVSVGDRITAYDGVAPPTAIANIQADVNTIRNNRFNIAVGGVAGAATTTASGTWDSTRTQTVTASFGSWNEIRYFFNAGGKIRFSFALIGSSPNTTEQNWQAMGNAVDTVSFGYTSTTSSGGVGTSGGGFYDLTASNQQVYSYVPPGYSSEQYIIEARVDGSVGSATDIIFTLSFITPSGGDAIDLDLESGRSYFDPNDPTNNITIASPSLSASAIS